MSLVTSVVRDSQGLQRLFSPGDVLTNGERIATNATVGAATLTATEVAAGILSRSGSVANFADTLPTSNDMLNGILGNSYVALGSVNLGGVQPLSTFRLLYINTVAFTMTLTTNTGWTLGSNVNIAASSAKEYLITVLNGTPQQSYFGNTTNASAVVTGLNLTQTDRLTVGMLVTGTNIPAGATIASIQPGVGFTLSANATGTALSNLTFSPRFRIDSLGQYLL